MTNNEKDFIKACGRGFISDVRYYINLGVDPSCENNAGIFAAIKYKHLKLVKYLLNFESVITHNPKSIIHLLIFIFDFVYHDDVEYIILRILDYEKNKNVPIEKEVVLIWVVKNNAKKLLKKLIDLNVNLASSNNSVLFYAIMYDHEDIVYELLQYEDITNSLDNDVSYYTKAVKYGYFGIVLHLLHYIDPSQDNNKLLYDAINYKKYDIFKLLISDKRIKEKLNHNNNNILYYALSHDAPDEILELILVNKNVRGALSLDLINHKRISTILSKLYNISKAKAKFISYIF